MQHHGPFRHACLFRADERMEFTSAADSIAVSPAVVGCRDRASVRECHLRLSGLRRPMARSMVEKPSRS